jgi:hypothetical protein
MCLVSRLPQRSFVYLVSVYVLDPNLQPVAPPLIRFENGVLGIVGNYFGGPFSALSFDFPSHVRSPMEASQSLLARKGTQQQRAAAPIGDQTVAGDEEPIFVDRSQPTPGGEGDDQVTTLDRGSAQRHDDATVGLVDRIRERAFDQAGIARVELAQLHSEGRRDAWMAAILPTPENSLGRMTIARLTRGAISLSSSSHFPLMPYSNRRNPVVLPPGRDRLATRPILSYAPWTFA